MKNIRKQMDKIEMLNNMLNESMNNYKNHDAIYSEWKSNRPKRSSCNDERKSRPTRPSHAEIKRLTMVIRQETIKLDRMI